MKNAPLIQYESLVQPNKLRDFNGGNILHDDFPGDERRATGIYARRFAKATCQLKYAGMPVNDVFGRALLDYHRGERASPFWWERSDGARIVQALGIYYEGFNPLEDEAMGHLQGSVLDIGCGAGKHLLEFARRGYDGLGLDLSPLAIRVCRERGLSNLLVADAFTSGLPDARFDSVTLFSNNLSIGGTIDGVRRILREAARLARNGARLILINRDVSASGNDEDRRYRDANLEAGRPAGQIRMRGAYKGRAGPWFDWLFVAPEELTAWAPAAGWGVARIIDGDTGEYCAILDRLPCDG